MGLGWGLKSGKKGDAMKKRAEQLPRRIQAGGQVVWCSPKNERGYVVFVDVIFMDDHGTVVPPSDKMPVPFIRSESDFFDFAQIIARIHGLRVTTLESLSSDSQGDFVTVVLG